jgi:hypothetical protein
MSLKKFTIVGYYADNDQSFIDHTTALTAEDAADQRPQVSIIAVFSGWIDNQLKEDQ